MNQLPPPHDPRIEWHRANAEARHADADLRRAGASVGNATTGLARAGIVAVWVWIVLALLPVLAIAGCLVLCLLGDVIGAADGAYPTSPP